MKWIIAIAAVAMLQAPGVEPAPFEVCEGIVDTECLHADCTRLVCARQFCRAYVQHSGHISQVPSCAPS